MFSRFWKDARGHFAIIAGVSAPVFLVVIGLAIDYSMWTRQQAKLQGIADATAIAAAREFYLVNADINHVKAMADSFAETQVVRGNSDGPLSVTTTPQANADGETVAMVQVDVSQQRNSYFSASLSSSFVPLSATAVAKVVGGGRLCVIGLDDSAPGTISLQQQAQVTANECAVYSNSTSPSGIDAMGSSQIAAELICSAGGANGSSANFAPSATTDCPTIEDPLSARPAPLVGPCNQNNMVIKNGRIGGGTDDDDDEGGGPPGVVSINPGVYCGGLQISNGQVELRPGIYVMKDGPLSITSTAEVWGENVGVYLTGDNAVFNFGSNSDIDFTAPKDGPMAGILFFEDRSAPLNRQHVISSKKADNLLGTIYLSRGIFVVSANNPVAQNSAYTAVIANQIDLSKKPNLYLNSDYEATDVPVPDGIGPVGGNIYLVK